MIDKLEYTNIREVISRVLRHPMLQDFNLEAAIQYAVDFIRIMGLPIIYEDRNDTIEIKDYRGKLPCKVIQVIQVREYCSKRFLRAMTDTFNEKQNHIASELSFKIQGDIIYTSFKEGKVEIAYKTMKTDEEGLPLIPDDTVFMRALELYIKLQCFTTLFECGKLASMAILQNIQQQYYFAAGQVSNRYKIPSLSEMQSITSMLHRLLPSNTEFSRGFKTLGDTEYIKRHQG